MAEIVDQSDVPDYCALQRLDGRVYAVVGAGRGIGRQTAHALRQAGADLVCIDSDLDRVRIVASEVQGMALQLDATRHQDVVTVFHELFQSCGRLDGVVDIVGASISRSLLDVDDDLINQTFELNLFQAIQVTRTAADIMARSGGGTIVLIGSAAGFASLPNQIVYGSAKAALHHFVRCAASELGHVGVRVNAVAPGYVRTERMVARFNDGSWNEITSNTPLQRGGETADIAGVVLFLSQDLSSFVTGQVIVADGGLLNPPRVLHASSARQISGQLINEQQMQQASP
jgi:NAD(P)-dependent dehydrogenase (short-subunit alcohol dehydrogenase family)